MIGWVVAAVSLFFLGLYYTNRNLLYASSDFASVLYTMTMILLFLLPAISMQLCGGAQEPHRPAAADQSGQHPGHRGR